MYKNKNELHAKIVVVGDTGVGKSSITIRYVYDKFNLKQQSTLGAAYVEKLCTFTYHSTQKVLNRPDSKKARLSFISRKQRGSYQQGKTQLNKIQVSNHQIKLQIWDTAGQQKYKSITKMYYRDCRVVLLVYDCTNRQSFDNLKYWYQDLIKHVPKNIMLFLIANKIDLLQNVPEQAIPYQLGQKFASEINARKFLYVSAKSSKGIDQLFKIVINDIGPILVKDKKGQTSRQSIKFNKLNQYEEPSNCCKS